MSILYQNVSEICVVFFCFVHICFLVFRQGHFINALDDYLERYKAVWSERGVLKLNFLI